MLVREYFAKNLPKSCSLGENEAVSNRILITCPKSEECDCYGSWIYYRSFIKHLKEVHNYNTEECKHLLGQAIMTSIENSIGSNSSLDYASMVRKYVDKLVASTNNRTSIPIIPEKGRVFYLKGKKFHFKSSRTL